MKDDPSYLPRLAELYDWFRIEQQNGEMMGASKVAIELCADLPAHQSASVERLVNSSLMLGDDYKTLMSSHIASIGTKKG